MDDDGLDFQCQPGDQVDNDVPVVDVAIKRLGPGRNYFTVAYHDTIVSAIAAMNKYNERVVTRIKRREYRNVSCSYYWNCVLKSCGCTKEYRILSNRYDCEEESEGDRICHELYIRNGGRGMSTGQVAIVNEASQMGSEKPKEFLKVFRAKAKDLLASGISYIQTSCIRSIIL